MSGDSSLSTLELQLDLQARVLQAHAVGLRKQTRLSQILED
jgi:hypothetical protein